LLAATVFFRKGSVTVPAGRQFISAGTRLDSDSVPDAGAVAGKRGRGEHIICCRAAGERAEQHDHGHAGGQVVMEGFMHWRMAPSAADDHPDAGDYPAVAIIGIRGTAAE